MHQMIIQNNLKQVSFFTKVDIESIHELQNHRNGNINVKFFSSTRLLRSIKHRGFEFGMTYLVTCERIIFIQLNQNRSIQALAIKMLSSITGKLY